MNERPELNIELDAATFRSFYYLKQELVDFYKENGLPASGSKAELTDRKEPARCNRMLELQKGLAGNTPIRAVRPSCAGLTNFVKLKSIKNSSV